MSLRRLKNLIYWLPPESAIVSKLHPPDGGHTSAPSRPQRRASLDEMKQFFGVVPAQASSN